MAVGTSEQVASDLPPKQAAGVGGETTASAEATSNNHAKNKPQRAEAPDGSDDKSIVVYDVEHLATFATTTTSTTNNHDKLGKQLRHGSLDEQENGSAGSRQDKSDDIEERKLSSDEEEDHQAPLQQQVDEPREALQRLFELEKLSGIWTQRMQIELRDDFMLIVDCESNSVVERFDKESVTKPEAFSQYNDIYNNIVVFTIRQQAAEGSGTSNKLSNGESKTATSDTNQKPSEQTSSASPSRGELHIFQCVSHEAQQLVSNILAWKSSSSTSSPPSEGQKKMDTSNRESDKVKINGGKPATSGNPPATATSSEVSNDNGKTNGRQANLNTKKSTSSEQTSATSALISSTGGGGSPSASSSSSSSSAQKPVVTVASCPNASENVPIVNVNVKETVQVFNQIAALREKSKPNSPTNRPLSDGSAAAATSTNGADSNGGGNLYKQRSIRAILAPKFSSSSGGLSPKDSPSQQQQQQQLHQNQQQSASMGAMQVSAENGAQRAGSKSNQSTSGADPATTSGGDQLLMKIQNNNIGANSHSQSSSSYSSSSSHHQHQSSSKVGNNSNKQKSSMPANGQRQQQQSQTRHHQQQKSQSDSSRSHVSSSSSAGSTGQMIDQVTTNESYVSVLNHCFDDIEKFIIRIQHAAAAARELQAKRKLSKRSNSGGQLIGKDHHHQHNHQVTASELAILSARARGPSEDDYFEILSKFKLAFNLLAKLKGCIHEPNAPELVHFLFTPLAIIIDSARNVAPPIDPTIVGIPYLNQDALDLLSNCCTSKESDMWLSLGPNWTQTIDPMILKASRLPSSFQPIFSDGWAPVINELELIGLIVPPPLAPVSGGSASKSAPANNSSIGGALPTDSTPGGASHRRHQHAGEDYQQPLVDPAAGGYAPGLLGNGRSKSSHVSHRSQKSTKRGTPPTSSPSHARSQSDLLSSAEPYLEPLPPPPPHAVVYEPPERSHYDSGGGHRISSSASSSHLPPPPLRGSGRSMPLDAIGGQYPAGRRNKHSSRSRGAMDDYPMPPTMLADSAHLMPHPLSAGRGVVGDELDLDYMGGSYPMNPSGDYTELHNQHLDDMVEPRRSAARSGAGPSARSQHQRLQKAHSQPSGRYLHQQQDAAMWPAHQLDHQGLDVYDQQHHGYPLQFESDTMSEHEREAMLLDLGPAQAEWYFELQSRGALIVRVLFSREANNDKELSVRRGEILEVLDDSRKWWRARNINLQVAHVPHTIVAVMNGYQTIDELLTNNPISLANSSDPAFAPHYQRAPRRGAEMQHQQQMPPQPPPDNYYPPPHQQHHHHQAAAYNERRNSKTAGAFRYF